MTASKVAKICMIYFFVLALSCSSCPTHTHFQSSIPVLKIVQACSQLVILINVLHIRCSLCWLHAQKLLLTLNQKFPDTFSINSHRFCCCFFNKKCLKSLLHGSIVESVLFSELMYPWLYQCPFAVTMLLGSGATYSFIYGLGFSVTIRVTFPNVLVCRRHPNGSLTWKALIVFSFPLLNYLSGPSQTGQCCGSYPAH